MTNSTDAELRARLTPEQYKVTQKAGTERAFSGDYWDTKTPGVYRCVVCEMDLFASDDKYNSGTGWPSFTSEIDDGRVSLHSDRKFLVKRTEVRCASCESHLGHVFGDGPRDAGGQRYCLNSAALTLDEDETEQEVAS